MAEKKAATVPAKKAVTKKAVAKKAPARATRKGEKLECGVCGFVVTVDEDCGCVEEHEIICCGEPMKARTARATRATKAAPKVKAAAKPKARVAAKK